MRPFARFQVVTGPGPCAIEGSVRVPETGTMAEYKHGEMEVADQEAVFLGFVTWVKNVTIVCFLVLIFLAIFNS